MKEYVNLKLEDVVSLWEQLGIDMYNFLFWRYMILSERLHDNLLAGETLGNYQDITAKDFPQEKTNVAASRVQSSGRFT